jgi:hypothetical protein
MFASISLFIIGLALGYGLRELLSRRRRAAARREYYERHPDKITANEDVEAGNPNGQ